MEEKKQNTLKSQDDFAIAEFDFKNYFLIPRSFARSDIFTTNQATDIDNVGVATHSDDDNLELRACYLDDYQIMMTKDIVLDQFDAIVINCLLVKASQERDFSFQTTINEIAKIMHKLNIGNEDYKRIEQSLKRLAMVRLKVKRLKSDEERGIREFEAVGNILSYSEEKYDHFNEENIIYKNEEKSYTTKVFHIVLAVQLYKDLFIQDNPILNEISAVMSSKSQLDKKIYQFFQTHRYGWKVPVKEIYRISGNTSESRNFDTRSGQLKFTEDVVKSIKRLNEILKKNGVKYIIPCKGNGYTVSKIHCAIEVPASENKTVGLQNKEEPKNESPTPAPTQEQKKKSGWVDRNAEEIQKARAQRAKVAM